MTISLSDSYYSQLSLNSYSSSISGSLESIPSYSESVAICPKYTLPNEVLPSYTPTLQLYGLCLVQLEFNNPYCMNSKRSFEPMLVELNSTQLILYKLNCGKTLSNLLKSLFKYNNIDDLKKFSSKDRRALKLLDKNFGLISDNRSLFEPITDSCHFQALLSAYRCEEFKRLTLQNIQMGIAPCIGENPSIDPVVLVKYSNCLRVRIELNQFLFQFWSFHSLVEWYRNLTIGKDLSDFESITHFKSLPRFEMYRQLMEEDKTVKSSNEIVIEGYLLFMARTYSDTEVQFLKYCIPDLNSYDKWKTLVLSNFDRFDFNASDDNLYINHNKLNTIKKTKRVLNKCRTFSVQQEGLVSLACHQVTSI